MWVSSFLGAPEGSEGGLQTWGPLGLWKGPRVGVAGVTGSPWVEHLTATVSGVRGGSLGSRPGTATFTQGPKVSHSISLCLRVPICEQGGDSAPSKGCRKWRLAQWVLSELLVRVSACHVSPLWWPSEQCS